jgi:hypothetical protein
MPKPTLILNPPGDNIFVSLCETLMDRGIGSINELEHGLRSEYSDAAVHARQLSGEPRRVWYVYRDGRWVNGKGGAGDRQDEAR